MHILNSKFADIVNLWTGKRPSRINTKQYVKCNEICGLPQREIRRSQNFRGVENKSKRELKTNNGVLDKRNKD